MLSMNLHFLCPSTSKRKHRLTLTAALKMAGRLTRNHVIFRRTLAKRLSQSEYRDHGQSIVTYYIQKTLAL